MTDIDEITKAIGAHGLWKVRLREAIEGGKSEFKVDVLKMDNQCAFGKWLYGPTIDDKTSPHYTKCLQLHREFHLAAGKVLELALIGQKDAALKSMDSGDYFRASSELTLAMMAWRK